MEKQGGLGDHFLIGGYDLSGDVSAIDQISGGPALLDVTAINKSAHERIGGLRDGGLQFTTFFNAAAGAAHPALSALPRADTVAAYLRGAVLGGPAAALTGKQVNYDPSRDNSGALTLKVDVQANGSGLDWGVQATPGSRTDTTATDGDPLDNGAASTHGAQAYLQVVSVAGTSVTVTVQHSADDSTYTDLIEFDAVAAGSVSGQRKAVTGTVDRYVRVSTSGTFSSAVLAVVFARNRAEVAF